jgi:hypothetical protein
MEPRREAVRRISMTREYRAGACKLSGDFASYDPARRLPEFPEVLVTGQEVVVG